MGDVIRRKNNVKMHLRKYLYNVRIWGGFMRICRDQVAALREHVNNIPGSVKGEGFFDKWRNLVSKRGLHITELIIDL